MIFKKFERLRHFKVGDSVQQKSGGPFMTVESLETAINGKTFVSCTWSEGATLRHRTFLPTALKIATDLTFTIDLQAANPDRPE